MYKIIIRLLWVSLIVYMFCPMASAEEPLQHGYYVSSDQKYPQVPRIDVFEAKKLYDQGKLILANVMETQFNHIQGSIWLPVDKIMKTSGPIFTNHIIAFYCS